MAFEPSKHVNGRMWPPGVSGNPNGRPVGSRTVFSPKLSERPSLGLGRAWWRRHGKDGNRSTHATCARLIGPEVKLTIEQSLPGNLSMEDWQMMKEVIAAVRQVPTPALSLLVRCSSMCCQRSGRLTPN